MTTTTTTTTQLRISPSYSWHSLQISHTHTHSWPETTLISTPQEESNPSWKNLNVIKFILQTLRFSFVLLFWWHHRTLCMIYSPPDRLWLSPWFIETEKGGWKKIETGRNILRTSYTPSAGTGEVKQCYFLDRVGCLLFMKLFSNTRLGNGSLWDTHVGKCKNPSLSTKNASIEWVLRKRHNGKSIRL